MTVRTTEEHREEEDRDEEDLMAAPCQSGEEEQAATPPPRIRKMPIRFQDYDVTPRVRLSPQERKRKQGEARRRRK